MTSRTILAGVSNSILCTFHEEDVMKLMVFSLFSPCLLFKSVQRYGCDLVENSDLRFDNCGVCGGDNSLCEIQTGRFESGFDTGEPEMIEFQFFITILCHKKTSCSCSGNQTTIEFSCPYRWTIRMKCVARRHNCCKELPGISQWILFFFFTEP